MFILLDGKKDNVLATLAVLQQNLSERSLGSSICMLQPFVNDHEAISAQPENQHQFVRPLTQEEFKRQSRQIKGKRTIPGTKIKAGYKGEELLAAGDLFPYVLMPWAEEAFVVKESMDFEICSMLFQDEDDIQPGDADILLPDRNPERAAKLLRMFIKMHDVLVHAEDKRSVRAFFEKTIGKNPKSTGYQLLQVANRLAEPLEQAAGLMS